MEKDALLNGTIIYRNLFLKIIKCNDQANVRTGYVKYQAFVDNNLVMTFACKKEQDPYLRYIELKNM